MTRRRALLVACLASAVTVQLWAHPGVGIVKDPRGFVFYTDLAQIWQIDPAGHRSIAVPNVHTHELAIDSAGNLLGEEVRGAGGGWQHRIWRRTPDGHLTDVVPWTDGFWQDDGLARDGAGNRYWVVCPEQRCVLRRREPKGRVAILARDSTFHYPINWLAPGPGGVIYFPDGPDLRRMDPSGRVSTVAAGLAPPDNQNALMGLKVGADGAVFIAVPSRGAVLRVAAGGEYSVAATSPAPWAPSGFFLDADHSMWILEFDPENHVQVRHFRPGGEATVY